MGGRDEKKGGRNEKSRSPDIHNAVADDKGYGDSSSLHRLPLPLTLCATHCHLKGKSFLWTKAGEILFKDIPLICFKLDSFKTPVVGQKMQKWRQNGLIYRPSETAYSRRLSACWGSYSISSVDASRQPALSWPNPLKHHVCSAEIGRPAPAASGFLLFHAPHFICLRLSDGRLYFRPLPLPIRTCNSPAVDLGHISSSSVLLSDTRDAEHETKNKKKDVWSHEKNKRNSFEPLRGNAKCSLNVQRCKQLLFSKSKTSLTG